MLGLMTYSFHEARGSLLLVLSLTLFAGIIIEITEFSLAVQTFLIYAAGAAPYVVIQKSEGTPKWESYLLAMPIRRKNLASILYLNVFTASFLMIPITGVVWLVGFIFNNVVMEVFIDSGFIFFAIAYGAMLLFAALIYPISSTKFGGRSVHGLFFVCLFASVGANIAIFFGGRWLGLSDIFATLLSVSISMVAFVVSLFITRVRYAKIDF